MSFNKHDQTSSVFGLYILVLKYLNNSSSVLILHAPSVLFVGPNNLFLIFLSVTDNFCFVDSFSTHVLLAYVITANYNFNLVFFVLICF